MSAILSDNAILGQAPSAHTIVSEDHKLVAQNHGYYYSRPRFFSPEHLKTAPSGATFELGENFVIFYSHFFNKGAALSRVIHALNDNHHFRGKKVYLVTAGDSIFDVPMLSPTLRYPFLNGCPAPVELKPLPANVQFLRAILTRTTNPEDQKDVYTLMEDFPELKLHIVKCPAANVLSLMETLADVLSQGNSH